MYYSRKGKAVWEGCRTIGKRKQAKAQQAMPVPCCLLLFCTLDSTLLCLSMVSGKGQTQVQSKGNQAVGIKRRRTSQGQGQDVNREAANWKWALRN